MAAVPIWKDFFVQLAGVYRIIVADTGDVIYTGYAQSKPGETSAQVRINDICADYLENVLPSLVDRGVTEIAMKTFKVQGRVTSQQGYKWDDLYTAQFYNDWSYDYGFTPGVSQLSCPINGHIDARQPILFTAYNHAQVAATLVYRNGSTENLVIPIANRYGTLVIRADHYGGGGGGGDGDLDRVIISGKTYKVVTECAKYVLYYVNAFGGWDSLLIEGNALESDSLKRFTREVVYDNRDIQNRGIHNYVNEVTKGFTFHSGWLLDDQGERMHHLINSTFVYLYDIDNRDMIPVTIPTTSCEYRTYRNQGNRLVDYTIQVQVAHNRIRR